MSSPIKSCTSANFYRFASVCAAVYVVAQIFQDYTFHHGISDSPAGEQAILQRPIPLDQFRLTLLLLSFFPITVAFAAVALRQVRTRPAASVLGFTFSLLFVIAEIVNRSIDLFVISKQWRRSIRLQHRWRPDRRSRNELKCGPRVFPDTTSLSGSDCCSGARLLRSPHGTGANAGTSLLRSYSQPMLCDRPDGSQRDSWDKRGLLL